MSTESSHLVRFVAEAREHLGVIGEAMIALERSPEDRVARVERLLRSTHSLKGGAGFTGCRQIEKLAHAMEAAAENIRDGEVAITPEVIDALLFALDRITALVDDVEHSEEADITEPLSRLRPLVGPEQQAVKRVMPNALATPAAGVATEPGEFMLSGRVRAAALEADASLYGVKFDWHACEAELGLAPITVAQRVEGVGTVLDSQLELAGGALSEGLPRPPFWYRAIISSSLKPEEFARRLAIPIAGIARLERVSSEPSQPQSTGTAAPVVPTPVQTAPTSLRVSVPLIDRMMELAGELALVRNQALRTAAQNDPATRRLMRRLDTVTSDLHNAALQMRMQPVSTLFDRFPRLVRDLARQLGKQIELNISGAEVELDKSVLEMLADPLTHLIRNCCDHGIEMPERRAEAGKPSIGHVRLSARQERGQIVIEIRDDGRGIDSSAVKRKAVEQGLKSREEMERLSPRQVYEIILLSGFSTAASVTDVSGRGVGMDVVKTNLEQIGGAVEIDSTPGQGSVFLLRLPLTLAIMPCLLLRSGSERYAMPQRDVEEILLLDPVNGKLRIECSHDEEVLRLREVLLPAVRLEEVLGQDEPFDARTWSGIIARHHGEGAGPTRGYAAVVRAGSRRFVLVFDEVLLNEEIVVKPLNPLLRPLSIYAGSTILGDGGVAMILSAEGISRHSGILQKTTAQETPALPEAGEMVESLGVLVTRHGADQLLAIPLGDVRRVIMIAGDKIEQIGDRSMVHVDQVTLNIIRFEEFLKLPACPPAAWYFLVVPRLPQRSGAPIAFLVSEIVDTETIAEALDRQAYVVAGVKGSAVVRGQIALVVDLGQFAAMWEQGHGVTQLALPAGPQRKILVVEDTKFFQALVGNFLREQGHEVVVAENGKEGLEQLRRGRFDLVVSDIEMPVMDGLTFVREVRADAALRGLPMIALTTLNTPEARQRAMESGFDGYEIKFDRMTFSKAITVLLAATMPGGERSAR